MTGAEIRGVGLTRFGRMDNVDALGLMQLAADEALADAQIDRSQIDGVLCGYATTLPHLMLSDLFAERAGIRPRWSQAIQLGGATGAAMVMLAADMVKSGRCQHVLVVAGENRLSGQSRDRSMQTLSQVGDADFETRNGATVPAFYALLASRFLSERNIDEAALAALAVTMRRHASLHPGAHLRAPIDIAEVLASRPIATPLKLLDCCPISDGACAFVVSRPSGRDSEIQLAGAGQAHQHQHITAIEDIGSTGAALAANRALAEARRTRAEMAFLGIYDSFTITLAMLLDELRFASAHVVSDMAMDGVFSADGDMPLNTHGGLLSYGHCGVAGGMAHIAEAVTQMRGRAGDRQLGTLPPTAFIHADGGVMSAHVSLVLERTR